MTHQALPTRRNGDDSKAYLIEYSERYLSQGDAVVNGYRDGQDVCCASLSAEAVLSFHRLHMHRTQDATQSALTLFSAPHTLWVGFKTCAGVNVCPLITLSYSKQL